MTKIETTAEVSTERRLTVDVNVPEEVSPGLHRVVVMIESDETSRRSRRLQFASYPVGLVSDDFTFRREDLYDDGSQ
jgi:hypothetical protein